MKEGINIRIDQIERKIGEFRDKQFLWKDTVGEEWKEKKAKGMNKTYRIVGCY